MTFDNRTRLSPHPWAAFRTESNHYIAATGMCPTGAPKNLASVNSFGSKPTA